MLAIMADRRKSATEKGEKKVYWMGPKRQCWAAYPFLLLGCVFFLFCFILIDALKLFFLLYIYNRRPLFRRRTTQTHAPACSDALETFEKRIQGASRILLQDETSCHRAGGSALTGRYPNHVGPLCVNAL